MSVSYVTVRHRCEHCRRSYAAKSVAAKHERDCFRNPSSKSCPTCVNYKTGAYESCAIGLGLVAEARHFDDARRFIWEQHCDGWVAA